MTERTAIDAGAARGSAGRAVEVKALGKTFVFGGQTIHALRDVSFAIERGTVAAIVGRSGTGKTTLVNILGGLDSPSSGEAWVAGVPVHTLREGQLTAFRRHRVGFVFQSYNLIPNLSALENAGLPLEFAGVPRRAREERAAKCLIDVGLPRGRHRHPPSRLSGGEQQRVAVARALVNDPDIVLADEPTGNLDSSTSTTVMDLLSSLAHERGKTVLVVTHDRDLAARADVVLTIEDGQVRAEG